MSAQEPQQTHTDPGDTRASERTASKLRALLGEHHKTGRDLAAALNISPQSASRRLRGEHDFKLNELEQIAAWLELPVEALMPPGPGVAEAGAIAQTASYARSA